jgi:6-phosphogluconate dehydrogenase
VDATLGDLSPRMQKEDVIVDGGNSYYIDDRRRAGELQARGIHYIDAGTSGGVWGLERGFCLMIGGDEGAVQRLDPLFKTLAPGRGDIARTEGREKAGGTAEEGYLYCGPSGAGHFVKMVHNGIEYGLMQSYAEGFEIMSAASEFDLDLHEIASIWRYGSVVRSWLLELTERALRPDSGFDEIKGTVTDSGEGRWTVEEAIERAVPAPAISAALYARFASRQPDSFADKLLAALRNQFGGHPVTLESGQAGLETQTPKA